MFFAVSATALIWYHVVFCLSIPFWYLFYFFFSLDFGLRYNPLLSSLETAASAAAKFIISAFLLCVNTFFYLFLHYFFQCYILCILASFYTRYLHPSGISLLLLVLQLIIYSNIIFCRANSSIKVPCTKKGIFIKRFL